MKFAAFGEILWDLFPDKKYIGGAPFNFTAHAAKLGVQAKLISAVGCDALGTQALEASAAMGVDLSCIARTSFPTGYCAVTLRPDGSPRYDLREGVAYDAIPMPDTALSDVDLFYFGTLAQRDARSRYTLHRILQENHFQEILCDINIRHNYYTPEILVQSLHACTMLKLSREDAAVFAPFGYPAQDEALCRTLAQIYAINTVVMTLDADGAMVYERRTDTVTRQHAPKTAVVSAVGAGDSFAACFTVCLFNGESVKSALEKAVMLASFVVSCTEAIPDYPSTLLDALRQVQ